MVNMREETHGGYERRVNVVNMKEEASWWISGGRRGDGYDGRGRRDG